MKIRLVIVAILAVVLCACSNGGEIRELTAQEVEVTGKMRNALAQNRAQVYGSLDDLRDNGSVALREQHSLSVNLAKAKLLESMRSPWVNPHPDLAATQKEVALYHLYALAEAEQELLTAKIAERKASVQQVRAAYGTLVTDAGRLIGMQKTLLAHLNQPTSTQVLATATIVAAELREFGAALEASDDHGMRRIAGDVNSALSRYEEIRRQLEQALNVRADLIGGAR